MASVTLILHGHYAKKDVVLRGVKFTKGKTVLPGTFAQNEGLITYLGRCYQAYPEHLSREEGEQYASQVPQTALGHTPTEIPGSGEPSGAGPTTQETDDGKVNGGAQGGGTSSVAGGDGHEDPRLHTRLISALNSLDPKNDEHWTKAGLPALSAVELALGGGQVTRKEIDAAIPGFSREIAAGTGPQDPVAPPQT